MNKTYCTECSWAVIFTLCIISTDGKLDYFGFKDGESFTSTLCHCDITGGMCDVCCCCDEDCSVEDSSAFTCHVATHSDDTGKHLHEWKCDSLMSVEDFHFSPFLCIQKTNSPYLGHYFPAPKAIVDLPSLNLLLSKQRNIWKNIPDVTNENKILPFRTTSGYVLGQTLELHLFPSLRNQEMRKQFMFPFDSYNGICDLIHPLSFLEDIKSSCITKIRSASDFSLPNSLFSISTFLIGNSSEKNLVCSPGDETSFTNVSIIYQHVANPCCYVSSINCSLPRSCVKDVTVYHDSFSDGPVCSNGICRNVVAEVDYHIFWKGPRIVWMNITFTLINVPLVGDQGSSDKTITTFLKQHFCTSYVYLPSFNGSNMILDYIPSMRSGKYGYEIGLPLIGSSLHHNESEFEQDSSSRNKSYLFIPVNDIFGKCILEKVNFGQDFFSGCLFDLKLSNFSNCTNIRSLVLEKQSQVLQVSMISKFGDPDFQNVDDFVEVLQEEFTQNASSDNDGIEAFPWQPGMNSCNEVPDHVQLHILYTDADNIRGLPVYRVIGAIRRYETKTWFAPCDYMESCQENKSFTFPLTAAVHFNFISSKKNRKIKTFWVSSAPVYQCKEETCWEEILYPLMPSFTLNDIIGAANNCFIVLLFFLPFAWLKIRHS